MTDQAIAQAKPATGLQVITKYLDSDAVLTRFAAVVGSYEAGAYINSALLQVKQSDDLQACTPDSIYVSALRAAILRLSCDPSTGEAYLVPYGKVCTLIVGWRGMRAMALRTGLYRYLNVSRIYEGMTVEQDPLTGWHKVTGAKTSSKVIGYLGAFELANQGKTAVTVYMTVDECDAHGKKYSKTFGSKKSLWQSDPESARLKTVWRALLRLAVLDPLTRRAVTQVDAAEVIDGTAVDLRAPELTPLPDDMTQAKPARTREQNLKELGY